MRQTGRLEECLERHFRRPFAALLKIGATMETSAFGLPSGRNGDVQGLQHAE